MTSLVTDQQDVIDPNDPAGIVEGIIPYFPDDQGKTRYLSYRSTGFGVRESCGLAGVSQRSIQRWRNEDPLFRRLDLEGLQELRQQVGNQYLQMEFSRNFRMFMEVDRKVIEKKVYGRPMTKEEVGYLNRIRTLYTPQQLEAIEHILGQDSAAGPDFDLTSFVLRMQKTAKTSELHVKVER